MNERTKLRAQLMATVYAAIYTNDTSCYKDEDFAIEANVQKAYRAVTKIMKSAGA